MTTRTPLRYPGGKSRLTGFIRAVMEENGLIGGHYVEPYCGGAGVAINLLCSGDASHIHINDLNPAVYAFWNCVFEATDELCDLIRETPVTMETWHAQKGILNDFEGKTQLQLGFAAFFLNRTNRSGILTGGVIGGKEQKGKWKLDARYNTENLCLKIETIAAYSDCVSLYKMDAEDLLESLGGTIPKKSLVFLDPPYFVKSKRLYQDLYVASDHARIAKKVHQLRLPWVLSYDDVPEIRELYSDIECLSYGLQYSAGAKYQGAEALFVSPRLSAPRVVDPLAL